MRRVRDQTKLDELFPVWRYHPFFTNSTEPTAAADITHRRHAIIETVFADLIDGPLAHLPSGRFAANSAWAICAAITHNLLRAAGTLASASHAVARGATLRRQHRQRPRPARPPATPPRAAPARALALGRALDSPVDRRLPGHRTTSRRLTHDHRRPGPTGAQDRGKAGQTSSPNLPNRPHHDQLLAATRSPRADPRIEAKCSPTPPHPTSTIGLLTTCPGTM